MHCKPDVQDAPTGVYPEDPLEHCMQLLVGEIKQELVGILMQKPLRHCDAAVHTIPSVLPTGGGGAGGGGGGVEKPVQGG